MTKRTYPYKAWVLTPSFKPKPVDIVASAGSWCPDWDNSSTGKSYHIDTLYASLGDATRAGFALCDKQQADIRKRQERLDKRVAALEKANDTARSE